MYPFYLEQNIHPKFPDLFPPIQTTDETRIITEGDEYPQLVPDNIHMYENFKGP